MTTPTEEIDPFAEKSLYITLQHLRTVDGRHRYHWGLFATENATPAGLLLHATDTHRKALDLYREVRQISNPLASSSMVVILKIANTPGPEALKACAASVRLMDPMYLPRGERQWTCRVWIKEVLDSLHKNRIVNLPSSVDTIEEWCQSTADAHLEYKGRAKVFNDLGWMTMGTPSKANLSSTDVRSSSGRYYGPSPMDIDSTVQNRRSSPMVVDSTGPTNEPYYGPSPMDTGT